MDMSFARRGNRKGSITPVKPDFATLVAVAVARQSASQTSRVIAAADAGDAPERVSLVTLFASADARAAPAAGSFNEAVASTLTPPKPT